ncbi:36754_t:CDS:2, partial [Racocetra persica]
DGSFIVGIGIWGMLVRLICLDVVSPVLTEGDAWASVDVYERKLIGIFCSIKA